MFTNIVQSDLHLWYEKVQSAACVVVCPSVCLDTHFAHAMRENLEIRTRLTPLFSQGREGGTCACLFELDWIVCIATMHGSTHLVAAGSLLGRHSTVVAGRPCHKTANADATDDISPIMRKAP